MIVCLTKRHVGLSQYLGDPEGDEKPFSCRVEADHVVEDSHIERWLDEKYRELHHLLGKEVHVGPVHSIEMFSQENRQLHTEDIHHGDHHVVDVGDHEEEGSVDAGHPRRGVLLTEEYRPEYQRDHLHFAFRKQNFIFRLTTACVILTLMMRGSLTTVSQLRQRSARNCWLQEAL